MANHVALIEQMRVWAGTLEDEVDHRIYGAGGNAMHQAVHRVISGLRQTADDLERGDTEDAAEGEQPDDSHP
jgi:hypothetical protein